MIPALIDRLLSPEKVDPRQVEDALYQMMLGKVPEAQIAGLLVALRSHDKDATILAACARAMRAHRRAVHPEVRPLVDTCGTGGDKSGTFNVSTAAALVIAAAGGAVAKHGNRSVSSKAGSADVLEAAGCALNVGPEDATRLLDATGFAFLFAPLYHPATAHVAPVRKALGIRTLFNLLGPLTNPALASRQLLGVYRADLTEVMAETLLLLGTEAALVVHCDGLDEIGLHAVTHGHLAQNGKVEQVSIDPSQLGISRAPLEAIVGGDAAENARLLRATLRGEPGPRADVVALNAGCALHVAGLVPSRSEGVKAAFDILKSGAALRTLERYAESSQRAAKAVTP